MKKHRLRRFAIRTLSKGVAAAGGIMLSRRAHQALVSSRAAAVAQLVKGENARLKPGLTVVVFSFNRALQLHATLQSYFKFCKNPAAVIVQYAAATPAHAKAYAEVEKLFAKAPAKVSFVRETRFAQTLPQVLAQIKTRNMFFLVDDDIFIRKTDLALAAKIDPLQTVYSLRLGAHLRRSYTMQMAQLPPRFTPAKQGGDLLEFRWGEKNNEWAYPYSVEGHVFSTAEIKTLSSILTYKAPNTYEGVLNECAGIALPRTGLCHAEARLLNLAINKVQNENDNIAGDISPDFLLAEWQKGNRLAWEDFTNTLPLSPHIETPVRFVKRKS